MLTIQALNLRWIQGAPDDPLDQCAHGEMMITVNGVELVTAKDGELTLSGAAFFLLRTLKSSHTATTSVTDGNHLLPCCAFNAWPAGEGGALILLGCGVGIDFSVEHLADDQVRIARGVAAVTVEVAVWRAAVIQFARQIDAFYASSTPKVEIDDAFDRKGWALFWAEWRALIGKYADAA
ncbi:MULTISPECIES: hypothetical protein [unclassified Lysobacter]|uniref:hypothetical protein n=1 Tax=unclassified Lysobacter TaxID=2635362 RepID=UPI00070BEA5C|nr:MULTISPECIES: hypothetical protein [unclassified Lysobacter]KRD39809.1 hypothetical protein ASE35_05670 [Lysobacter sp. Root916]KRD79832.1 hypothetical protein ASE43_02735 [Lysobacter sp. Root983]